MFFTRLKKRDETLSNDFRIETRFTGTEENPNSDLFAKKFAAKSKSNFAKFAIPIIVLVLLASIAYLFFNRSSNQTAESKNFTYTQLTAQSGEELFPNLAPMENPLFIRAVTSRKLGHLSQANWGSKSNKPHQRFSDR